jgi:DNA-binding transcriptional MerR regulator
MAYTIGEASEKLGLTPSALRYYDKEGLLPYVNRSANGLRMFSESDLEWLRLIECLKATGMPIKDIRKFIDWSLQGDSTIELRRDMFLERKRVVEEQIEAMKKTLDMIHYKHWYYDTAAKFGSTEAVNRMTPEELPEDIRELKKRIWG